MERISKACRVLAWILYVFCLFFQIVEIMAIANAAASGQGKISFVPLLISAVLLAAAMVLFMFFKKYRMIAVCLAIVTAIIAIVTAVSMGRLFPAHLGTGGVTVGFDAWRLFYAFCLPAPLAVLLIIPWRLDAYMQKIADQWNKKESTESTLLIDTDEDETGK